MTGELTAEEMLSAWERADAKNTSLPGTFYGHFESAWESADEKKKELKIF